MLDMSQTCYTNRKRERERERERVAVWTLTHSALCLLADTLSLMPASVACLSLHATHCHRRVALLYLPYAYLLTHSAVCLLADTLSLMPASHYFTCLELEGRGSSLPLLDTGVSACVSMSSLLLGLTQTCDRGVTRVALLALNVSRSRSLPPVRHLYTSLYHLCDVWNY